MTTHDRTYLPLISELTEILCAGRGGGRALFIPPTLWSGNSVRGRGCECCDDDGGGSGFCLTSFVKDVLLLGSGGGGCE